MTRIDRTPKGFKVLIFGILLLSPVGVFIYNFSNNNSNSDGTLERKIPKSSGFWVLSSIYIDDYASGAGNYTWAEAVLEDWCSGSGTWNDPYRIENVTFDGGYSGSALKIFRSTVYFVLKNCTFRYANGSNEGGLWLWMTENGYIDNCSFIDNIHNGFHANGATMNNTIANSFFYNYSHRGIYLNIGAHNNTVLNNTFKLESINSQKAIEIMGADDSTIIGNNISDQFNGISLSFAHRTVMTSNNISQCSSGIQISTGAYDTMTSNNNISKCTYGIITYGYNTSISENTITECTEYGIYSSHSEGNYWANTIINNDIRGIHLYQGRNITIAENLIKDNYYGVSSEESENNTISSNMIRDNYVGVQLQNSHNNTISGNTIIDNLGQGIILYLSKDNHLVDNVQSGSWYYGLLINVGSNTNTIVNNSFNYNSGISDYGDGIRILNSVDNEIIENTMINNSRGIMINDYAHNNLIVGNKIYNNDEYGILILDNPRDCENNTFYNNFISNPLGINGYDNGINTQWDNGSRGNYWSDYSGTDADEDGIGDTPYVVPGDEGNQDNFPIWDESNPTITLNSPLGGTIFEEAAPTFNITIFDLNLHMAWYMINYTDTRYFFTPVNGENIVQINETAWDSFAEGSITISFFVNDTYGNTGTLHTIINKDVNNPTITLNFPLGGTIFGEVAPTFNVTIFDLNLHMAWYTINYTDTKYFFTPVNGENVVQINETAWDSFADGSITISFFVNDTSGKTANLHITLTKELSDGTIQPPPAIPFGNSLVIFIALGTIAIIIYLHKKKIEIT